MQAFGATAVAVVVLLFVDQLLNGGRYSEVVLAVLAQVGSLLGVHLSAMAT